MPDSNLTLLSEGLETFDLNIINDNILILIEKMGQLVEIQFHFLVLTITIIILGVIYFTFSKFIR